MKAIPDDYKEAKRLVACCVCDNFKQESETHLLATTMAEPPPESWLAPLRATVHSIIIEGAPDPYSLDRQYRVPKLKGMAPAWSSILVSPHGFYAVLSETDTTVQDRFVYPIGNYADMHVDTELTHASSAKACVCNTCANSLKNGKMPQFACANDLCIGISFPSDHFCYTFIFSFRFVHI
jgi:hypothetical protein